MRTRTAILMILTSLVLLYPDFAHAKRTAPTPVPAVTWNGIEYRAPLDVQHMGRVQAYDLSDGHMLWETKAYRVVIIPLVEADNQWVFVSSMQVQDGSLLVVNENGKSYRLDLKTGRVSDGFWPWFLWILTGCLAAGAVFFVRIRRKQRPQSVSAS